jgi:hypothetical protein
MNSSMVDLSFEHRLAEMDGTTALHGSASA